MGIVSHIFISEVNRAYREKEKRRRAQADRVAQAILARDPGRPLWPTAEELARQQQGRNGR